MVEILKAILTDGHEMAKMAVVGAAAWMTIAALIQTGARRIALLGVAIICSFAVYAVYNFVALGNDVGNSVDHYRGGPPAGPAQTSD